MLQSFTLDQVRRDVVHDGTIPLHKATMRMVDFARRCAADDVISSAVRLSLTCPITRLRIGTPARSERCKHVECFDLDAFLQCQRASRTPKWQCPICSTDARPHRLRICTWFVQALELPEEEREVQLEPDGSLTRVSIEESPMKKRKVVAMAKGEVASQSSAGGEADNPICLDDDD